MYDETKQKSLFEKFDRVVIQPVKQEVALPGADLEFCKQVQEEFDKMVESLEHFQALYEEFQKSRPAEKLVKLNLDTFCPVADFREKKQESKQAFVNAVFRYFQDKYYLEDVDLSASCLPGDGRFNETGNQRFDLRSRTIWYCETYKKELSFTPGQQNYPPNPLFFLPFFTPLFFMSVLFMIILIFLKSVEDHLFLTFLVIATDP